MAAKTFAERIGLATMILELFQRDAEELEKRGLNVSAWVRTLREGLDTVLALDVKQETEKAQLRTTTKLLREQDRRTYALASGAVDAAMAAYGKNSIEAKQISRIRSQIRRMSRASDAPPEAPPTA